MIFVTVGHQIPFDRMMRLVDAWASESQRTDIFAQIGDNGYVPKNFPSQSFISPAEYERYVMESSAIVAHAGVGSIVQALYLGKPLLVLPRLSALGETRNDHQVGTARHFSDLGQILMAKDDDHFLCLLDSFESFRPSGSISSCASPELIKKLTDFVDED